MLFFKKYCKKIGVCLALLAMVFCTFFGINKLDLKKDVTAKADNTSYVLSGTWTFKDVLVLNINSDITKEFVFMVRHVNPTWTTWYRMVVSSDNQTLRYDDWTVTPYSTANGWYASYCKTIYIVGGQTVDKQFYDWFTANAYPVSVSSAGGGTGGGYTQEDLDQAFQDGVNSVDTNAIRQEGYDEGYGKGVADSVAEGDYGVFIGSTWTYQAYDTISHPPLYEQLQVPFENILKEGSKFFFNSTTLSAELNAIQPPNWNETHVVIDFAAPVIKGGLLLGFDTSQLPVHFSITANGYAVKLVDNSSNPELSSRYVLDFSNVPDGTFINNLGIYLHSGQGTKDRDWVFGSTALVTDINLYSLGYNEGYKEGEDSGYDKGYEKGDEVGFNRGFEEGDDVGYNRGYNTGVADSEATADGFYSLISAVIDAPVKVFTDILDFELLGYNMNKFVVSLLTACLMIAIVKLFSGFAG